MDNVNDSYFDGYYKDVWRSLIPAELTTKEVDFMVQYFNLSPGSKVLDIMCGYGRHAIALAEKGIEVTAIDNLEDYITEINKIAGEKKLPVKAIKSDIARYNIDGNYDLAICMGNSLNFFDEENARRLLKNIHTHLKADGHLLTNTWSLAEIAIRSFAARSWSETDGVKHISESKYLFNPTRIESTSTFLFPDGKTETKQAVDYVFSVAEMKLLLQSTGFELKEIYSIPGRKKFTLGEPRAYIIAEKFY